MEKEVLKFGYIKVKYFLKEKQKGVENNAIDAKKNKTQKANERP
jgi:hypothetical protein